MKRLSVEALKKIIKERFEQSGRILSENEILNLCIEEARKELIELQKKLKEYFYHSISNCEFTGTGFTEMIEKSYELINRAFEEFNQLELLKEYPGEFVE